MLFNINRHILGLSIDRCGAKANMIKFTVQLHSMSTET